MEGIGGYVIVRDMVFDIIKYYKTQSLGLVHAGHQVVAVGTLPELGSVLATGEFDDWELYGTKAHGGNVAGKLGWGRASEGLE